MKLHYLYILVFSLHQLQLTTAVRSCKPLSQINGLTAIVKKIGEHFNMRCPFHPCIETAGEIHSFTKINATTGTSELIHKGRVLHITITDYSDAGTYCCTPRCSNTTEPCCINIQVQSEIAFYMNEIAYVNQNYTASCTIRSNPKTNLYIFTQGCRFQYTTIQTDEFEDAASTSTAIIEISNITQECTKIICSTNLFQKSKTIELLRPPESTEPLPETQHPTTEPFAAVAAESLGNNSNCTTQCVQLSELLPLPKSTEPDEVRLPETQLPATEPPTEVAEESDGNHSNCTTEANIPSKVLPNNASLPATQTEQPSAASATRNSLILITCIIMLIIMSYL